MAGDFQRVSYEQRFDLQYLIPTEIAGEQAGTIKPTARLLLEYLDFNDADNESWCIEGGAQQLDVKMAAKLKDPSLMSLGSRITGIDASAPDADTIQLNGEGKGAYTGVFSSTTMGCMQKMDLRNAGLTYG